MSSVAIAQEYGSPAQIAKYLGISERTVHRHCRSGLLPSAKVQGRVLIAFGDADVLVRRSQRDVIRFPPTIESSLGPDGRAVARSGADGEARTRSALAVLDDLDEEADGDAAGEPEADLARLLADLRANRGDS